MSTRGHKQQRWPGGGQRPKRVNTRTAKYRTANPGDVVKFSRKQEIVSVPSQMVVSLSFTKSLQLTTAGTNAARFLPNGAYDIDPTLGSTSAVGFFEWSGFYARYQVLSYDVKWECLNQDVLAAELNFCNTSIDPGTSSANYPLYARNFGGRTAILGSVNSMNRVVVRQRFSVAQIIGGPVNVDSLTALDSANPTNVIFTGVGLNASPVGALGVGVTIVVTINLRTRFYERKLLIN